MSACAQNYHIHELVISDGRNEEIRLKYDRDNCQFFPISKNSATVVCVDPTDALGGLMGLHPDLKVTTVRDFDLLEIIYSVSACIKSGFEIQKFKHPFKAGTTLRMGDRTGCLSGLIICPDSPLFIREKLNVMFEEKGLGNVFGDREGIQFIS